MVDTPSPLIDLKTLTERLNMRPAEVYREIKAGALKAASDNGQIHFDESDVNEFLNQRQEKAVEIKREVYEWLHKMQQRLAVNEIEKFEIPDEEEEAKLLSHLSETIIAVAALTNVFDFYLDPVFGAYRLLARENGVLQEWGRMSTRLSDALRQSWKQKAGLAEQVNLPASGLLEGISGCSNQARLTVAPTLMGEHLHLAFQIKSNAMELTELGYTEAQAEAVQAVLDGKPGLFITVGSADAYSDRHRFALANTLAKGNRLVISLEHRQHFRSELLVQLQVRDGEGEEFGLENALRTALEMSPDAVFLDDFSEKMKITALPEMVNAGLTVIMQVRCGDNGSALLHLLEKGLTRDFLARALLGMTNRVAFRRLCQHCKLTTESEPDDAAKLDIPQNSPLSTPGSCERCGDGYTGRLELFDVWINGTELAAHIEALEPPGTALRDWIEQNKLSLYSALREAVLRGDVSVQDATSTRRF